ncbi:MAG: hypothetical protein EOP05_15630, partial [Proteobacteria bacterium]
MIQPVLPTRKDERWKYTNLNSLLSGAWEPAEALDSESLPARTRFKSFEGEKSAEIVILNGKFVPEWSTITLEGLSIKSSPVTKIAAVNAQTNLPAQETWSASYAHELVHIEIKPSAIIKKPIVITTYSFGSESLATLSIAAPRVEIKVGKLAEVAFVEFAAGEGRTLALPSTSISVANGARVSHARINLAQDEASQVGYTKIDLTRDSFCETYQFSLTGQVIREDLDVRLMEPG